MKQTSHITREKKCIARIRWVCVVVSIVFLLLGVICNWDCVELGAFVCEIFVYVSLFCEGLRSILKPPRVVTNAVSCFWQQFQKQPPFNHYCSHYSSLIFRSVSATFTVRRTTTTCLSKPRRMNSWTWWVYGCGCGCRLPLFWLCEQVFVVQLTMAVESRLHTHCCVLALFW